MTTQTIPEGYKENAQGHLIPISKIPVIDMQRDELVRDILDRVEAAQAQLEAVKDYAYTNLMAHLQLSAEQYGVQLGGEVGNANLSTLDGSMAIKITIDRPLQFDDGILAAKQLIDACLLDWSGDNENLKILVHEVFKTNPGGNFDAQRVLDLTKYSFDDPRWTQAMDIINKNKNRRRSKKYIRFYKRSGEEKKLKQVVLNFSALDMEA